MKNTYIPIEAKKKEKRKTWYLDVTNLGLEELITLKSELTGLSISCLDAVIYERTISSAFIHKKRQEQRENGRRLIRKRVRRNSGYKGNKRRRDYYD